MEIQPQIVFKVLPNGVTIHCVDWSQGVSSSATECTPIVLVHGLASNARLWDGAARELTRLGHLVIAIDQRGHGRSDKPDDGYDMATVTNDLALLIDELVASDNRWQQPLVIGQSWGGNVVIELAHKFSDKVRGVCAVDGGTIQLHEHLQTWDECATQMAPPKLAGMPAERLRAAMKAMHPDWSDESINGAMSNMEVLDDGTIRPWLTFERHLMVLRGLWEHSPFNLFSEITVPVMLVPAVKSGDTERRRRVREAQSFLSRCIIAWFDDADHDLHAQHPEKFARSIHDAIIGGHFAAGVLS